ncbi:type II and III secretion system protein [Terriglobus albidus]|uniref:Type II and III secretion system protein n=1 Tax=Terriglobus albidus TaxID=1592106 RepID=A0A5B9EB36_9BACT|nr:pilus assembly protein N-terminal domain-containing protein [Terriglobus albidus]QEE27890.1 type II and III secretion system protein [Terriglobus albidus]
MYAQTSGTPMAAPGASTQDSANDLVVAVGKSVLVDSLRSVSRIAVGSSDIAEATAVSPSEVMINGKAPGETTLIVWQAGGARQFFNVKVYGGRADAGDKLEAIRRELRTEFPGQAVRVSAEGGSIFLRGTVKDLDSSKRAVQIAATAGKVVNLLYVNVPAGEPQILLKVRFASVDRNRGQQLGLNVFSTGATNSIGTVTTQQFAPPTLENSQDGSGSRIALSDLMNIFIFRPDLNLGATLQAMQTTGVLQVLAEPNVLTSNGKQGSFLAGGQFPFPVVQGVTGSGTGAVTIQFKEFGVRLDFIPTITPRGTIRLQVAPEVSSLDFANGVRLSGFNVPAISTRKVKTEVELGQGQSFAIGGLLDNRETKNLSKIPFIGDVPVLGKLFQSMSVTKSNTELVVIITPEIVNPIPAGAPRPEIKFPDKFLPSLSGTLMENPSAPAGTIPPPATISVEKLVESMKPGRTLQTESMTPVAVYNFTNNGETDNPQQQASPQQ